MGETRADNITTSTPALGCLPAKLAKSLMKSAGSLASSANTPDDWIAEKKFGLFIHWCLYATHSTYEWAIYRELIPKQKYRGYMQRFAPDRFDDHAWAARAKAAGMRYMVFSAKHHDGFCMWDTDTTDFKVTRHPFGRDVLAEVLVAGSRDDHNYADPEATFARLAEVLGKGSNLLLNVGSDARGRFPTPWYDNVFEAAGRWLADQAVSISEASPPSVTVEGRPRPPVVLRQLSLTGVLYPARSHALRPCREVAGQWPHVLASRGRSSRRLDQLALRQLGDNLDAGEPL